jgi:predicted RNA binding protein YcfA (HicA-like mRNA interferase family)
MTEWPSVRARRVLAALQRTGLRIARQRGSHRVLVKEGGPTSSLHFTTEKKLGRKCLRVSRAIPACARGFVAIVGRNRFIGSVTRLSNRHGAMRWAYCARTEAKHLSKRIVESRAPAPTARVPGPTIIQLKCLFDL